MHLSLYIVGLFLVVFVNARPEEKYSTKFDNFDIDSVLDNRRILKNYIKCFMDQGSCTAEAKDFKRVLPEVIETNCLKCNDKQTVTIKKVIKHIKEKNPDDWAKLLTKYDATGKYRVSFEKFVYT